jgi:hypothetical protein
MKQQQQQPTNQPNKAEFWPQAAADYEVIALGPVSNGYYQWSIATSTFHQGTNPSAADTPFSVLFVLARDPSTYYAKYEDYVVQQVKNFKLHQYSRAISQDNCTMYH